MISGCKRSRDLDVQLVTSTRYVLCVVLEQKITRNYYSEIFLWFMLCCFMIHYLIYLLHFRFHASIFISDISENILTSTVSCGTPLCQDYHIDCQVVFAILFTANTPIVKGSILSIRHLLMWVNTIKLHNLWRNHLF